ncbi:alcohol dehydrogenase [Aeromicrobium sp. A1-2]|uniref:NADP-dependent oxidoreductase n=1 Tax=Aeromicrobium sp. A1-2 TaxID=2107713 RepID=UPI000E4F5345|nr:NADP-dependent oxidoreductase [Aeromicrobium sp. A1-2]AXT85149.1 alcohol dehydrogenase [Aeromicrobium sp. A1-2]
MKAITYSSYGDSVGILELTDVDEPKIGPDWVKVAVRASSVNPVDWKLATGGMDGALDTFFPVTPGWDVAGVVEQVGPAVTTLEPGDEVFGYVRKDAVHGGTYAEKVSAPIRTLARKPRNASFAEAAAIPLAGLTAFQTVVHALDIGPSDTVLIHGASGGVGSFAVQIAASLGARVLGTASEANHDYLRGLGAEPFVYGEGLVDRVRSAIPEGVTAVLDFNGADLAVSPYLLSETSAGRIASVIDPGVKEMGGQYVFVSPDFHDLEELAGLFDDGTLTVEIAATFALADTRQAWELSQQGHTRGKIVITVD